MECGAETIIVIYVYQMMYTVLNLAELVIVDTD
jgi:hypothetical protein